MLNLPPRFTQRDLIDANSARQMTEPAQAATLEREGGTWFATTQEGIRLPISPRGGTPYGGIGIELEQKALDALPTGPPPDMFHWVTSERIIAADHVRDSLAGRFVLRTENSATDTAGLRVPQVGAVHAVLAHWLTSPQEPATVVLPTGTGKTETMLSLIVGERLPRVLILVPSDRLRSQISGVVETYGVLRKAGVLDAPFPGLIVGRIEHAFSSAQNARVFAQRCNVIVATPPALHASDELTLNALIGECSHLFVDEAHHLGAKSWSRIRDLFVEKPVLQFTATPYREDGQALGGRVIYSFPLGLAQELGYFEKIRYDSVVALAEPDRELAKRAIEHLRSDVDAGFDHLIMARVKRIARAREEILPLYEALAPDFAPVLLHSDLSAAERRAALTAIERRDSRIVVCVDMLGEGFDFPELKVAAIHDAFRSLGPTLQFIGRFARRRADLGNATAVVARPDPGYDPRLTALYAEGQQWDSVIERLSEEAIGEVRALDEFAQGFAARDREGLPINVLRPKMSAVVYRTSCTEWQPDRLASNYPTEQVISPLAINHQRRVAWIVIETHTQIRWGEITSLRDTAYHLHLLWWDRERALLYINTSQLDSLHQDLAELVCGSDVARLKGDEVYRALADVQRPTPTNVGLIDLRSRSRRFSMHVGADVYEGFPVAEQQSKANTNIFLVGFRDGERVSIGAAAKKGRVWSQRAADSILEWVQWCDELGPSLNDATITMESLLRDFVRPKPLDERPVLFPLAIDWPWIAFAHVSESVKLQADGEEASLIDAELRITEHTDTGPIQFEVRLGGRKLPYEARVEDETLTHHALGQEAMVIHARSDPEPLSTYLNREGSTIWFEREVVIAGSVLYELQRGLPPINLDRIVPLDWAGIKIRRESQGPDRDPATVQAHAAAHLVSLADWEVIVDDDQTGEIADLVAFRVQGERLIVHLVHCKFSSEPHPGARVTDLYELCGQAHRSAHHRQATVEMIDNLIRRERNRAAKGHPGLMVGDEQALLGLQDVVRRTRPEFRVTIVQPGFSKKQAQARHLQLLGAVEVYVSEVAHGAFDMWCSE